MEGGRQQQDDKPPRRTGRAFPSPQLYQPRRRQQEQEEQHPSADRPPQQQHPQHQQGQSSAAPAAGSRQRPVPPSGAAGRGPPGAGRGRGRSYGQPGTRHQQPYGQGAAAPAHVQPRWRPEAPPAEPAAVQTVEGLVAAAGDPQQPPAARAAALQQLHQRLFDPAAQRQALQQLPVLWPRLLALLWEDPSPAVAAAAAPAVGAIGALAAQASAAAAAAKAAATSSAAPGGLAARPGGAGSAAGGASGLLFDWLLPVLQRRASPGGHPLEPHQLSAVLLAVRDCLTGVDAVTLARYANAVFGACQALLEDEATPPSSLPALLAVLQLAARHQHSLKARFQDLVDLLLGWALDPALPDTARPALMRTLAAFGSQWRQQPAFTATLLGSLLSDMERLAAKAGAEAAEAAAAAGPEPASGETAAIGSSSTSLRQLQALAACTLPMLDTATSAKLPACPSFLLRELQVLAAAASAATAGGGSASPAAAAVVAELAGHVSVLASLAPAAAAVAADGGEASSASQGPASPAAEAVAAEAAAGPPDPVQPVSAEGGQLVQVRLLFESMQALDLSSQAAASEASTGAGERVQLQLSFSGQQLPAEPEATAPTTDCLRQLFAAVAAFGAACSCPRVLAHTPAVLSVLAAVRSWVQMLAAQAGQLGAGSTAGLLDFVSAELLIGGSSNTSSSSWLLSLRGYGSAEAVRQVAQLLGLLLQHSPAALHAVIADTTQQAAALAGGAAAAAGASGQAALLFNLELLVAALPQLAGDGASCVWQQLRPLAAPGGPLASVWQAGDGGRQALLLVPLLSLLRDASSKQKNDQQQLSSSWQETLHLLGSILSANGASEPVQLLALQWLQQEAGQAGAGSAAVASEDSSSCAAALDAALGCVDSHTPAIRTAALAAAHALVSSTCGGAGMLHQQAVASRLYSAALLHLADVEEAAATAAEQLLVAAAAPLALSSVLHAAAEQAGGAAGIPACSAAAEAAEVALGAQRLAFRPAQLQAWLGFLTDPTGPSAVLTGAGSQQAAPLRQWLPRLLHSLHAVPPPRGSSTDPEAGSDATSRPPTACISLAAWWAVQEAAKQCVAARLRSHHGGPAQTLAALERSLHAAVGRLQAGSAVLAPPSPQEQAPAAASPNGQQAAVLLLLFLHALEQDIAAAAVGCSSRAAAPQGAVAFFAANDKVCRAWFARVRPLLFRAAAAAELHELAAHHSLLRLRDLQQQAQALQPAAASAGPASPKGSVLPPPAGSGSGDGAAAEAEAGAELSSTVGGQTPLAGRRPSGLVGTATADASKLHVAANPAAALLAATRGSPELSTRLQQAAKDQQEPSSPAAASHSARLAAQQAQQLAAKAAEAAAAAAAAMCALSDADGIAGLQAFCRQAFQPLLERLHVRQAAAAGAPASAAGSPAEGAAEQLAATQAAAASAWDWLSAVGQQAAGQYEAAIEQYGGLYSAGASSSGMQCAPTGALARLAAAAYAAVGDAGRLEHWLQHSKLGSKLPAAAASHCAQLASWAEPDPPALQHGEQQGQHEPAASAAAVRELLGHLQLRSLDPGAGSSDGSVSLRAVAPLLSEIAATAGKAGQLGRQSLLSVPPALLEAALTGNSAGSQRQLSAWSLPEPAQQAASTSVSACALQPLLLLLNAGPATADRQSLLTLVAAQAAVAGGNFGCASVLQLRPQAAEGQAALLSELQQLRFDKCLGRGASGQPAHVGREAWGLMLSGSSGEAAGVVTAAAQLLLGLQRPSLAVSSTDAGTVATATKLPLAGSGSGSWAEAERELLRQGREDTAVQYAALKLAPAAAPGSASQWWQLASFLGHAAQAQLSATPAARAAESAAFAASCQALACGAGSGHVGSGSGGFGMLPVLLQVLQLLCSPRGLPEDAAAQLEAVPPAAWLPVVPQLLARLASAAEAEAEDGSPASLLFSLLQRIGGEFPCQVLLPAMVAAEQQAAPGPAEGSAGRQPALLSSLVQHLRQQHPQLARQLAVLTSEAARLAVLPEEHWHVVLQEAAATAARRLQAQGKARRRSAQAGGEAGTAAADQQPAPGASSDSSREGSSAYLAAMAPVLLALQQQLEAAEAAPPQTPHERRFAEEHLPRLRRLFEQLMAPLTASQQQQQAEQGPVQLLRAASAQLGAALRPRQLSLPDVAPALAALGDTGIPIPGVAAAAAGGPGRGPFLAGMAGEVAVLSTKTRPKRLRLLASDGSDHSFLLKGREDLRAEARLMQLLRACDSALQAPGSAGADGAGLGVHCFEVTPLGGRVGLVQWVEGTVPLFELYSAWQQNRLQRQRALATAAAAAAAQAQAQAPAAPGRPLHLQGRGANAAAAGGHQAAPVAAPPPAQQLRPVDLYYAKLREAGIDPASPRDAWPLPKLVGVLESMQHTVDRQFLWREVWLGSSGAADWWQRQRSFASSVAATSMVGYLLGLGDRHLDNMLLRRRGARLVHIDFSVIFDRGEQLKVPEVVPFRLTQTLVAALGVTGVEGGFRLGCERALSALRANLAPLCALLEAALLDPGVDWEAEAAAKAASKAFARSLALRTFSLRHERSAPALAAAARDAAAALAAAAAALGPDVQQFMVAAGTAASAAESHALLQRCEATLSSSAAQEQQLALRVEQGRAGLEAMLLDSQPLAVQLQASLQECQAWQQRHGALLPLLLANPPAALLAGPAAVDPQAAAAAGAPPLLLVSSPQPAEEQSGSSGAGSIVHAALGMLPTHAPFSAGLLLQAAGADKQGQQLLGERAAAAQRLADGLRQYAAAVACLLGGTAYAGSSQHPHWLAAFEAAMDLPAPQGFERAAELAPAQRDRAEVAAGWRPLAAAAAAAAGLCEQLGSTGAALQLERVDLSLGAAEAREQAVEAAASMWSWAGQAGQQEQREQGAAALAAAFAAFSDSQAHAALQLGVAELSAGETAEQAAGEAPAVLEGAQRLILGYASMAVAVRDATSEVLLLAPDGSSLLAWLSAAVQAADSLSTAAAELQLLLPPLLALLHSPSAAAEVAAAVSAAEEQLEAADGGAQQAAGGPAEETAAPAAMQPLLEAAGQHPAAAALLQGLQRVQAASQLLLSPEEQPPLARQQLQLSGTFVEAWRELEDALEEATKSSAGAGLAAATSPPWQQCSAALAAAVGAEVAQHLLPPLAAALASTAQQLRGSAAGLARRAGLGPSAAAAAAAEGAAAAGPGSASGRADALLVPFTDFNQGLPGAGMLLGGALEEEGDALELAPGGRAVHAELEGSQPGGMPAVGGAEPGLVPFLDFDESLAGADELLEGLEPEEGFQPLLGGSQEPLSQPSGPPASLSQQSDDGAAGSAEAGGAGSRAGQPPVSSRRLASLLGVAAEAVGALAAVDAVQYVSGLALQQCQQLRQQHCMELAAFSWLNDHLLPAEAAAASASLAALADVSAPAAAAAGVALPPVHPAVASWALRGSRQAVLAELQAGTGTLQSLEAPLQQWQQQTAGLAGQLSAEVAAAAPYAGPALHQHLQLQLQWLQGAANTAAGLLEVSQAVLQFEASRTADAGEGTGAAAGVSRGLAADAPVPGPPPAVVDRFVAEQREGWQRYCGLLADMRQLQGSYSAAQRGVAAAEIELEQLRKRAQEAATLKRAAEEAGSSAAANFAALALPLVKSTQHLPPAVSRLQQQLASSRDWAAVLLAANRSAAELASSEAGEGGDAGAAAAEAKLAAEQLATAAACMQGLPAGVEALHGALLPVRNRLLAGGRGEAAAQQQAAFVVDSLSPAVAELNSQLEVAGKAQRWLASLPNSLRALASRAGSQAAALQAQHGFSLRGLEQLLARADDGSQVAGQAGEPEPAAAGGAMLTGSLLLTAPSGRHAAGGQEEEQRQRRAYADGVLRRVQGKLAGGAASAGSSGGGEGAAEGAAGVSERVEELIGAATSRANLARMYEGWMPWV